MYAKKFKEIYLTDSDVARFWSKVDIRGEDECWEWMGGIGWQGYGRFAIKRISFQAHRVSLHIKLNRQITEGLLSCHTCDIRHCVNPKHLWEGTEDDNMKDMIRKGRGVTGDRHHTKLFPPKGILNGRSILTEEKISEIKMMREMYGYSYDRLAKMNGVSKGTIAHIFQGISWKHLLPNSAYVSP